MPEQIAGRSHIDTFRFRTKAKELIPVLIQLSKLKQNTGEQKKAKRVVGSCYKIGFVNP
jgi:hypothetical protein